MVDLIICCNEQDSFMQKVSEKMMITSIWDVKRRDSNGTQVRILFP